MRTTRRETARIYINIRKPYWGTFFLRHGDLLLDLNLAGDNLRAFGIDGLLKIKVLLLDGQALFLVLGIELVAAILPFKFEFIRSFWISSE
jgi:hypothetical protein